MGPFHYLRVRIPHLAAILSALFTVGESISKGSSAEELEYMQSLEQGLLAASLFGFWCQAHK